jgi:hypothetical protein
VLRAKLVVAAGCMLLVGGASAREPLTQGFDLRVPVAPVPVPVSGSRQLLYELELANFGDRPLEPTSLEVLDAGTGAVLACFAGDALARRIQRPGAGSADASVVPAGGIALAYLELEGAEPRGALAHRLSFRTTDGSSREVTVSGGLTGVASEAPVVLAPPLAGGPWAAVYHPSWERGHRRVVYAVAGRAVIPGRYAIDWIRLDAEGRQARGDADTVGNWLGYAAEVLAVEDAVVAAVRDDVAESPTLSAHPRHALEDATGNYVVLELGGGRYAFYEHLKPGSIRVAAGERVQRGQPIAALGFTGQSTGPHLHFHVADGLSPLGSEGLPFVIDAFEVIGRYEQIENLGTAPWLPPAEGTGGPRQDERPAPNAVVLFR